MQEEQVEESNHLSQMVQWLEEQRKIDKDQMLRAQQDLERVSSRLNELTAYVQQIGDEVRLNRSHLATVPFAEEAIRQLREQLGVLHQRMDHREQALDRDAVVRQTEADRDRRALADLAQQVGELLRLDEQHTGRIQVLLEDMRRIRADLAVVLERVDASEKIAASVSGRAQLFDEYARRYDSRISMLEQVQETLKTDIARFTQWQQAADLRWSRNATQWQEQMDEWKRDASDHLKVVQGLSKHLDLLRSEMSELRSSIDENHRRIEDQTAEFLRLENIRSHDRDDNARLEQSLDLQRRRLDEQSDTLKLLQEQLLRGSQQLIEFESRFETERKRVDEFGIWFRQLDAKQQQTSNEMLELHKLLREQNQALAEQSQTVQRQLEDLARKWELQYIDLHQLVEQQKAREAAELERQLMEIRDRMNRLKG